MQTSFQHSYPCQRHSQHTFMLFHAVDMPVSLKVGARPGCNSTTIQLTSHCIFLPHEITSTQLHIQISGHHLNPSPFLWIPIIQSQSSEHRQSKRKRAAGQCWYCTFLLIRLHSSPFCGDWGSFTLRHFYQLTKQIFTG